MKAILTLMIETMDEMPIDETKEQADRLIDKIKEYVDTDQIESPFVVRQGFFFVDPNL